MVIGGTVTSCLLPRGSENGIATETFLVGESEREAEAVIQIRKCFLPPMGLPLRYAC